MKDSHIKKKSTEKYQFLFGVLAVILCTGVAFFLSLHLALYGDDWLRLWILRYDFDPHPSRYFSIYSYISGPYNIQYIFLFITRYLFRYNPFGYFLISLILRTVAAIFFYLPIKIFSKSSLLAWFGAILIGVMPTGIQVTDWVFYMNTYAALIPLSLTFYYLIMLEQKPILKYQIYILIFETLFIFLIPVRSYGFVFLILMYSMYKIIWQEGLRKQFAIVQLFYTIGIYAVAKLFGTLGPTTDVLSSIGAGISSSQVLLTQHNYSFLIMPFNIFGKIIFPDILLYKIQSILPGISSLIPYLLLLLFLLTLLVIIFTLKIEKKKGTLFIFVNLLIVFLCRIFFPKLSESDFFYSTLGLLVLLNTITLLLFERKKNTILMIFALLFLFSIPYYILPWLFNPSLSMDSTHRYLYFPAIGVLLSFIIIMNQLIEKTKRLIIIFSILIIMSILTDILFFRTQLRFRSEERSQVIWSSLKSRIHSLPKGQPSVFYIEDLTLKPSDVYSFGFPYHMGMIYGINKESNLPFILQNYQELQSAITDGKSFKKYTIKLSKPVSPNQIYFLQLQLNDHFVNNKNEMIKKIPNDKSTQI